MRLTLRTLLAYLDDTLDPAQTRQIGQKVAESSVAQELVEKIRRVTRKRSLTIPPESGPEAADANLVAEYLDNDLAADKVSEFEERALHSDVHLAEIAACHQLLTLILSEPAKVPPTARQRMYGVIKGPESDLSRQAPRVASATLSEIELPEDVNTNPLLSRAGGRKRLYIAGGLALLMAVAVWQAVSGPSMSSPTPSITPIAENTEKFKPVEVTKTPEKVEPAKTPPVESPKETDKSKVEAPKDAPKEADKTKTPEQPKEASKAAPPAPPPALPAGLPKPSDDRKDVGSFSGTGVLLQGASDSATWQRVAPNAAIAGTTRLMSLPGLSNEVRLGDALILDLFGTVPEIHISPLFESAATVFVPAAPFNADVRLDRGRIYLRASKPVPARVRLRLGDDVFDLTLLDDQCEIVAERSAVADEVAYMRDRTEQAPPVARGAVACIKGNVKVQVNMKNEGTIAGDPRPSYWQWTTIGLGEKPIPLSETEQYWLSLTRQPRYTDRPQAVEMEAAVKRLPQQLGDPRKEIAIAVGELADDRSPLRRRRLRIYAQMALDDMSSCLDSLDDPMNPDGRQAAAIALHNWLGRAADHSGKLLDALVKQKGFSDSEAELALNMFFGFSGSGLNDPKAYSMVLEGLRANKLIIGELAHWRIGMLDPEGARAIPFQSTMPLDARQRVFQEWKRRIPDGQLPPGRARPAGMQ